MDQGVEQARPGVVWDKKGRISTADVHSKSYLHLLAWTFPRDVNPLNK